MRELTERDKAARVDSIPSSNPVLFCPALQGHGNTLRDRSQYANNGVISVATWKRLPRGLSTLNFAGANSLVTVPDAVSLRLTTAIIMESWVKCTETSDAQVIMEKGDWFGSGCYGLRVYANKLDVYIRQDGSTYDGDSIGTFNRTTWAHIVGYFGAGHIGAYINGALLVDKTTALTTIGGTTGSALRLGAHGVATWKVTDSLAVPCIYPTLTNLASVVGHYARERHLLGV